MNISDFVASAVNPLDNIGIAVNDNGSAYVIDAANGIVLQTLTGLNAPQGVAIDAITDTAYVANSGNNTVSVVPLSTSTVNPLQIVESSPATTYVQTPNTGLTLSVVGGGFTAASKVVLDGTTVPTTLLAAENSARQCRPRCFPARVGTLFTSRIPHRQFQMWRIST